jgi:Domain of unknown function (DUF6398)
MASEDLRIAAALRDRAQQIVDVTDTACREHLDEEYGVLARRLVARLARKRPSPLTWRGWSKSTASSSTPVHFQPNCRTKRAAAG